jgi:hypothetical protein
MHIFAFGKKKIHQNMKRHLLLAAVMLLATANIFAQTETTTVITNDRVVTTTTKGDDGSVTIVERVFRNRNMHDPLPTLYYSYLNMFDGTFGPTASVPIRSSSFEWGFYFTSPVVHTWNNHFGISTGLGISNAYNFFSHNQVLNTDPDHLAYFEPLIDYSSVDAHGPANNDAHRSFLRYWSLRLPVMLQLQWNLDNAPMQIAAGAEFEWRFGMRSFARYGGAKHTISDNLDYSPVGFNILFSLVFDNAVIFFRSGLTDMMKIKDLNGHNTNVYQMSLGFGFNFD